MAKIKNKNTRFRSLITAIEKLAEDKEYQLRLKFAEGFIAIGNLSFGSLIFSQLLSKETFSFKLALGGVGLFTIFYALAILILKGKNHAFNTSTS